MPSYYPAISTLQRWRELEASVKDEEEKLNRQTALAKRLEDRYEPVIHAISEHLTLLFDNLLSGKFSITGCLDSVTSQKGKVGFYILSTPQEEWVSSPVQLPPPGTPQATPVPSPARKWVKHAVSPATIIRIAERLLPVQVRRSPTLALNNDIDISAFQVGASAANHNCCSQQ